MEGITYNPTNNTLLWVDIILAEVHRISLDNDNYEKTHECVTLDVPGESIGALFLTKDPNVVMVCAKFGLAKADFQLKQIEYVLRFPSDDATSLRMRSNDGIIDPWGNLWIGTMNDFPITKKEGVLPEGTLYRIDASDMSVKIMLENTQISNGLAFNKDGSKFYWTDSLTFTVWQFDYNNETKELSDRKPLIDMRNVFPEQDSPEPDGLSRSNDGVFYHAVFGTSLVIRYNSDAEVLHKYVLPACRITSTALGGANDDKLFITTAHLHLDEFDVSIDPEDRAGDLGGFLYRCDLPDKVNSSAKALWAGK